VVANAKEYRGQY
jgi:hypothetical protein